MNMLTKNKTNIAAPLYYIYQKVKDGKRITTQDAKLLYSSNDIITIAKIATILQDRYNQNKAYYVLNAHLNYSNICELTCSFCSFSAKEGQKKAYSMSLDQIKAKFLEANKSNISEIHIVGGLNKKLGFDYYLDMIALINSINKNVTIKAFTAVEIDYFSRVFSLSIDQVLDALHNAGLNMLPGGGAEIFAHRIRKEICKDKISGNRWLSIHEKAHNKGIKSTATMLFGHLETVDERIEHLALLRDLQDKTNGFLSFIPLTYHPDNNFLKSSRTSSIDELKTIAISRIFLDNFPHIKAYWVMLGLKVAQIALSFGADDLDGTILEEKITHSAGAKSPTMLSRGEIIALIEEAGKKAVERDAYYRDRSDMERTNAI